MIEEEYVDAAPAFAESDSSGGVSSSGKSTGAPSGGRRVGDARPAKQLTLAEFYGGDNDEFGSEPPRLVRLGTNLFSESTNLSEPPPIAPQSTVISGN